MHRMPRARTIDPKPICCLCFPRLPQTRTAIRSDNSEMEGNTLLAASAILPSTFSTSKEIASFTHGSPVVDFSTSLEESFTQGMHL